MIVHDSLSMRSEATDRLTQALSHIFGIDRAEQVIQESQLYQDASIHWGEKVCFGTFYKGNRALFRREQASQLSASLEVSGDLAACQDAVYGVLRGMIEALGSRPLTLKPKVESLEISASGDTTALQVGSTALWHYLLTESNIQLAVGALMSVAVILLGATLGRWDLVGLLVGAAPGFSVLFWTIALAWRRSTMKMIVWLTKDTLP